MTIALTRDTAPEVGSDTLPGAALGDVLTPTLRFYLNGAAVEVENPDPTVLLVDWLRSPEVGLTGTKKVCAQGGCGACTVMLTEWNAATGTPEFKAINACLHPICALDGKAITTTEGTGSTLTALSPVQYRIAKEDGTQCGFCTPGFVMTMHSFLAARASGGQGKATKAEIEGIFDGNLCRCTGYRPILYGMKHFASDWTEDDEKGCLKTMVDPAEMAPVADTISTDFPDGIKTPPRPLHYRKGPYDWYRPLSLTEVHDIVRLHPDPNDVKLVVGNTSIGVYDRFTENPRVLIDISAIPELHGIDEGYDALHVGAAVTYGELLAHLDAMLARTDLDERRAGVEALRYMVHRTAGGLVRNAASLAGNTMMVVRHVGQGQPFPSDAFTALAALDAVVDVSTRLDDGSLGNPVPTALLQLPFVYGHMDYVHKDMILLRYAIPWTGDREHLRTYKVALRPENSHSIVNAGLFVRFDGEGGVEEARLVFGGIGPVAFRAESAENGLLQQRWDERALATLLAGIRADVLANLEQFRDRLKDLPAEGFTDEYKLALAESFAYQFFVHVAGEIGAPGLAPAVKSAGDRTLRPVSFGTQTYESYADEYPVNLPYIKLSAFLQATGEARYTHDYPLPPRGLDAAVVTSQKARAAISYQVPLEAGGHRAATAQELLAFLQGHYRGIVDFVTAADIPGIGSNVLGPGNDVLFADGEVTTFGQCIGLVLAEGPFAEALAIDVAQLIAAELIVYTPIAGQEPILTIAEAKAKGQIFPDVLTGYPVHVWKVRRPESELGWAELAQDSGPAATGDGSVVLQGVRCQVLRGMMRSGSQVHFYMETQSCVAEPTERNRIVVHSSTQSPDSIQSALHTALGLPMNHIGVEIQRVGGGYGGKTTRSPFVSAAAGVAAMKARRPVKLALRRENDTAMIGHRHPLESEYRIAIATGEGDPDDKGRLMGLTLDLWSNGGNTYDCSFVVMDCIQLRLDSSYFVPNYQSTGDVCQTNTASNGAMRSMGLVQGLLVLEDAIEHAAHSIGMLPEEVRGKNLYQLGGITPVGQVLDYCYLNYVWDRIKTMSRFESRLAQVRDFNQKNRWKKRGISMIPVKYGSGYNAPFLEQAGALVEVYGQDATVLVRQGGVEIGQGLQVKIAQVVAKELNVPIGLVEIGDTDTQVVPNPVSTGASTGSGFNASAAKEACREIRARLEQYCLRLLEENGPKWCQEKGIDFWNYPEGWRAEAGPEGKQTLVWKNIVGMAEGDRVDLSAQVRFRQQGGTVLDTGLHYKPDVVKAGAQEPNWEFTGYTYSAACTEVEIDVLTGETTVCRADVLYDMGKSLNPAIDIGQVEGAYVQGLGYVLSEEVILQPDGPNKGALNTPNTWGYKLPATTSIPIEFNVDLFPRSTCPEIPENPYDLYSSKEVGEPPLVLAITAFFAVKHAILEARKDQGRTDWFFLEAPATVQRVREACLVDPRSMTMGG